MNYKNGNMTIAASPLPKKKSSSIFVGQGIIWAAYLLFFMMLFVPTTYQIIKAALLLLVLSAITIHALKIGYLNLHSKILFWTVFMIIVGLAFILRGVADATPGALRVGTIYVLWPFVYTLLVAGAANEQVLTGLLRLLVFATIAIGLYGLSYILYASGWLPDILYIPIEQGQGIGFHEGYIEYNLFSIASLIFLVPFMVGCLLAWPKNLMMPVKRIWLWVALFLGLLLVLLSGRRGLILVVVISPIITLILTSFLPISSRPDNRKLLLQFTVGSGIALVSLVTYLQSLYDFDLQMFVNMFTEGFQFDDIHNFSASARQEQFFALLSEWANSPVLGAGHGASAKGSLRSHEILWAYELSYVALLFHVGIVGFLCYTAGVVWLYWMGRKIIRSGEPLGLYLLPVLVGMTCFLIANATNPYLIKYDYIWVIFLPVAFINYWLLSNKSTGLLKYPNLSLATLKILNKRRLSVLCVIRKLPCASTRLSLSQQGER